MYPFLQYAGGFILHHTEAAEVGGVSQLTVLLKLQQGSRGIRRLRGSGEILTDKCAEKAELLHIAAEMGLYEILRISMGELRVDVNDVGGLFSTTL